MTFHGQITAASPLALAIPVTFNPAKFRTTVTYNDGRAVDAVLEALDELPQEVRESTLEEIAVREKTREVIATAKGLLSPEFYAAFLGWGEAASHFASNYASDADEEGYSRCDANSAAIEALTTTPTSNRHDQAVVGYLAALELADRGCFGPLLKRPDAQYLTDRFAMSVVAASPVVTGVEELSALVWSHSPRTGWDAELGAIATGEFSSARGQLSAGLDDASTPFARDLLDRRNAALAELNKFAGQTRNETTDEKAYWSRIREMEDAILNAAPTPDNVFAKFMLLSHLVTEGFEVSDDQARSVLNDAQHVLESWPARNPFMRGPLFAWERAYERYLEVQAEVLAYQRDVLGPADDKYRAVRNKWPEHYDFSTDPEAAAEVAAVDYQDEEARMDELYDQAADALRQVLSIPVGNPAQLATKLQLMFDDRAWETPSGREIMRQVTSDARRFAGLGAYLQTDEKLLTAYAGCRREMAEFQATGCGTDEEDAAAQARVVAHEEVIWSARATTAEGVLAKLRIAFQHIAGMSWSDHSIVDPKHADFRTGLAEGDGNDQLLWSAIEDLARIAGVNLSEQGA